MILGLVALVLLVPTIYIHTNGPQFRGKNEYWMNVSCFFQKVPGFISYSLNALLEYSKRDPEGREGRNE